MQVSSEHLYSAMSAPLNAVPLKFSRSCSSSSNALARQPPARGTVHDNKGNILALDDMQVSLEHLYSAMLVPLGGVPLEFSPSRLSSSKLQRSSKTKTSKRNYP